MIVKINQENTLNTYHSGTKILCDGHVTKGIMIKVMLLILNVLTYYAYVTKRIMTLFFQKSQSN